MNYELKDKIEATNEFLQELSAKGWQEVEYLQAQIANLSDNAVNTKLQQLLKNLLTSYYVFIGGVEALEGEPIATVSTEEPQPLDNTVELLPEDDDVVDTVEVESEDALIAEPVHIDETSEPFEYFVDFEEPIGEPLTDKDLYNN